MPVFATFIHNNKAIALPIADQTDAVNYRQVDQWVGSHGGNAQAPSTGWMIVAADSVDAAVKVAANTPLRCASRRFCLLGKLSG